MGGEIKTIIFGIVVCVAMSCLISELEAKEINRSIKNELEAVSQVSTLAAGCKCTNGYCEKDNNGKLVCKCPVEYGLDTSGDKCTKCNCGSNANCTFTKGFFGANQKDCLCPKGSYLDKTCKSCNCGKEFDCSFSIWAGKSCKCGTGYFDRNGVCVDICSFFKCKNEGICYMENGKPYCNCTERYAGKVCQTDKCSTVKCQNGGQCYIKGGKVLCNCTERFTGDDCRTDKCSAVKCQNGGQCNIKDGKAFCNCTERYTGDNCQTDKCSTVKCQNGGQCYIKGGNALCNCTERYIGDNCQIAYTTESEWNTTSNVTDELITLPNNGSRSTADEKDFNTTLSWTSTTESEDNSTLPLTTPFAEVNTTQSENMTAMTTNVNPRASTPTAIGTSIIVDNITNTTTRDFGPTTYSPLSTQKEFPPTPESTVPPSSTGTEKMVSPSSTEYPTTKTSPILELIKSFVVKVMIYEEKI